jgi:hypothetical protein
VELKFIPPARGVILQRLARRFKAEIMHTQVQRQHFSTLFGFFFLTEECFACTWTKKHQEFAILFFLSGWLFAPQSGR